MIKITLGDEPFATFFVGLPGSGKTYMINNFIAAIEQSGGTVGFVFVDDPKSLADFDNAIYSGKNIIATDPNLCFKRNLR